ncbi:MAG: hypothetical protein L0Y66_26125, partial [Myxococcaceae bacterium]|nr:hypothetical protein [Myxococcaceae bacterium]
GHELLPLSAVREVRRDLGPDAQLAYLVRLPEDRLLRLRVPHKGEDATLQAFVDELVSRAGLTWRENLAQRAA